MEEKLTANQAASAEGSASAASSAQEKLADNLVENLKGFALNRGNVYAFLSRCYEKEIDAAFAEQVSSDFTLESDCAKLADSLFAMKQDLTACDAEHLEQLAVVFDRAFFGMGPRTAQKAFPYESVYTSAEGLMMQDAYSQVVSVYRKEGLAKDAAFREPEDHLAVQFAFMRALCDRTFEALKCENGEEAQRLLVEQKTFLEEHVLTWINRFAADLRASAEGGFYAHLATFTEAFVDADAAALNEVLG